MQKDKMKVMQKVMLKTILAFTVANKDFQGQLRQLAKINSVMFNRNKLKKTCPLCKGNFENILLLILHLQLIHNENICITSYVIQREQLSIQVKDGPNLDDTFLKKVDKGEVMLMLDLKNRTQIILGRIFEKFYLKKEKPERQYYSTVDVFMPAGEGDEQENLGAVERELQKMRICDFTDVSESDKRFFLVWNDFVSKSKKTQGISYIDNDTMGNLLKKFCESCKSQEIHRNSLLMHLWTLWSAGKIGSYMITDCLAIYDKPA